MITRYFNPLKILINDRRSILLFGPRGTGKTALIKSIVEQYSQSISIDLLRGGAFHRYSSDSETFANEVRNALKTSPDLLLVTIDEVQKIPALLDEVHSLIEEFKNKIVFLLTGSSARKLKRGGANLLAGRALTRHLHPLSYLETDIDLHRSLQYGTLPAAYLSDSREADFLESYVSTYLQEEIQQEALVRSVERFSRFLDFAGQMNGEPISFAKLGKQCGVSGKTAQDYYSILTDTMLARQINGWSHSVKKQLLQSPKFYLFDCGVLNAINGELKTELKTSSFRFGRLFETLIVNELFRVNDYCELGLRFFYWRDKNGREVDIVVARNISKPLLAIEIKSHSKPTLEDCPGFESMLDEYPKIPRLCICTTPLSYEKDGIKFLNWKEGLNYFKDHKLGN